MEVLPLTTDEFQLLKWKWLDKKKYIQTTYLVLSLVLFMVWFYAPFTSGLSFTELMQTNRFKAILLSFLLLFTTLSIFFFRYYRKEAFPYFLDLKTGIKEVHYFIPLKYQTPFFAEYFIRTPLEKCRLIKITATDFERITSQSLAAVSFAPVSGLPLQAAMDGIPIEVVSWTPINA